VVQELRQGGRNRGGVLLLWIRIWHILLRLVGPFYTVGSDGCRF